MRIVAGAFRGRRLQTPKNDRIRPTSDRVREALFSMISGRLSDARVLDLFAGTGALGLESLSRGASRVVFVDESSDAVRLVYANITLCGVQERAEVICGAMEQVVRRLVREERSFDLIFMDPPYGKGYVEKALSHVGKLASRGALVIAEHSVKDGLPAVWAGWVRTRERRYGDTVVSFFERELPC